MAWREDAQFTDVNIAGTATVATQTVTTQTVGTQTLTGAHILPVTAGSTGTIITNHGITTLASTAAGKAFAMAAPAAGCTAELHCTLGSTTNTSVVTLVSGTFDGTNHIATFNAAGDVLTLTGLSTAAYSVKGNVGSVALSTA